VTWLNPPAGGSSITPRTSARRNSSGTGGSISAASRRVVALEALAVVVRPRFGLVPPPSPGGVIPTRWYHSSPTAPRQRPKRHVARSIPPTPGTSETGRARKVGTIRTARTSFEAFLGITKTNRLYQVSLRDDPPSPPGQRRCDALVWSGEVRDWVIGDDSKTDWLGGMEGWEVAPDETDCASCLEDSARTRAANGRVEWCKGGRVEGWKGGRVEGWKGGTYWLKREMKL
jgi:hypothetical protein